MTNERFMRHHYGPSGYVKPEVQGNDTQNEVIRDLTEECVELREAKDAAYRERNKLVAHLTTIYESHLSRHPDEDKDWERDWMWIVCVHGPAGQMTWHIHDSELSQFDHLPRRPAHWDGHSTEEKYRRLDSIGDRSKHCCYGA